MPCRLKPKYIPDPPKEATVDFDCPLKESLDTDPDKIGCPKVEMDDVPDFPNVGIDDELETPNAGINGDAAGAAAGVVYDLLDASTFTGVDERVGLAFAAEEGATT